MSCINCQKLHEDSAHNIFAQWESDTSTIADLQSASGPEPFSVQKPFSDKLGRLFSGLKSRPSLSEKGFCTENGSGPLVLSESAIVEVSLSHCAKMLWAESSCNFWQLMQLTVAYLGHKDRVYLQWRLLEWVVQGCNP